MIVFICSDSNQRSSSSDRLIVNSRVASAIPRVPSARMVHAAFDCSSRSPTVIDPRLGGTWCSSGPTTSVTPWIHAS